MKRTVALILLILLTQPIVFAQKHRSLTEDQRIIHVLNRLGFGARPGDRWASYVVGTVFACLTASGEAPRYGIRLVITSDVPAGKGVSSSAALEVAAMSSTAALLGADFDGAALAMDAGKR